MNNFLLTSQPWWVYSLFVSAKSLTGFGSLLVERIPPLSGFFVSGIYFICPLFFYGWIFWGAFGLAGLNSSLPTHLIRPPVQQVRKRFLTVNKGA
ncbi:MAG: hypothetical protein V9E86_00240 [Nitrosomonas sp.]